MPQENSQKILESILFSGAVLLTTLFGLYLPLITFIWPVPVALAVLRQGGRNTIAMILPAAIIAGLLWGSPAFLGVVVVTGLVGMVMGGALAENFSGKKTVYISVGVAALSQALFLAINQMVLGIDIWALVVEAMEETAALYDDPAMQSAVPVVMDFLRTVYPTLLFVSGVLTGVFSLAAVEFIAGRLKMELPPLPRLTRWKFDPRLNLLLLLTLFMYLILPSLISINLFLIIITLFCCEGLSVIAFWIDKRTPPRNKRFFLIALLVLFIFPVLGALAIGFFFLLVLPLAMVIGIFDSWRDLRKLDQVEGG